MYDPTLGAAPSRHRGPRAPSSAPACTSVTQGGRLVFLGDATAKENGAHLHKQPQCHPWTLVTVGPWPRPRRPVPAARCPGLALRLGLRAGCSLSTPSPASGGLVPGPRPPRGTGMRAGVCAAPSSSCRPGCASSREGTGSASSPSLRLAAGVPWAVGYPTFSKPTLVEPRAQAWVSGGDPDAVCDAAEGCAALAQLRNLSVPSFQLGATPPAVKPWNSLSCGVRDPGFKLRLPRSSAAWCRRSRLPRPGMVPAPASQDSLLFLKPREAEKVSSWHPPGGGVGCSGVAVHTEEPTRPLVSVPLAPHNFVWHRRPSGPWAVPAPPNSSSVRGNPWHRLLHPWADAVQKWMGGWTDGQTDGRRIGTSVTEL